MDFAKKVYLRGITAAPGLNSKFKVYVSFLKCLYKRGGEIRA